MLDAVTSILVPVHRDGYKFVAIFAAVTLILFLFSSFLGTIGIAATVWCAYFFRDPDRVTPLRDGLVISPADGRICSIVDMPPPPELDLGAEERVRVSVFMNVFDVHINRSPLAAKIVKIVYIPGRFINAELDKSSEENERQALTLETAKGIRLGVVQIAGLVARRIVPLVTENDTLDAGERFGLIRFGSRVDVYLPPGQNALVAIGQRVIAGETVLADLASNEPERQARRS